MDRPRRSTRNSLYASVPTTPASTTPAAATTLPNSGVSVDVNPYKKPLYLAGRESLSTTPKGIGGGRGRGRGRGRKSGSLRGNSKPECVATRVESRRSTGGSNSSSSKKKKSIKGGAYNSQDYHYGSDFESDQNESDGGERAEDASESFAESSSELENDDPAAESDSDFSITSSNSRLPSSRVPSPPVPLWMDSDNVVEELELPKSSDDLLLVKDLVMKAVAVYEPLRRFHQIVRLSPFRFEDFCAAVGSADETSALLTEIHIQLLKTILREEEANSTMFGPLEVKDSLQAVLFFIDNLTWPECLRSYMESDQNWADVHEVICSVEYPFCSSEIRLKILSWMVDQLLQTNAVREVLLSEHIKHDDHCRACNKLGQLLMCDSCPAVFHLDCIIVEMDDDKPPTDWKCPVCTKHMIDGITDCTSELEKAGLLIRHEKLGTDRHGRKYWFLVRRVLVESEDGNSIWYYTTPLQVEELLYRLDEDGYEAQLVENIKSWKEEIFRQMDITDSITEELKGHKKSYIESENEFLEKIHAERQHTAKLEQEERLKEEDVSRETKRIEEEKKFREDDEVRQKEEAERKKIREERLLRRNQNKFTDYNPSDWGDDIKSSPDSNHLNEDAESNQDGGNLPAIKTMTASEIANAETQLIDSEDGELVKAQSKYNESKTDAPNAAVVLENESPVEAITPVPNRRKTKAILIDWDTEERMTQLKSTGLYKLGADGSFKSYVNNYNADLYALSKNQHAEERDKKRFLSHKFSLTSASEIKWQNYANIPGLRSNMVSCLRSTLSHLEGAVPATLLHCNWPQIRKTWVAAVGSCSNAKEFSKAMVTLAACMRSSVFNTVWFESLAHHKMFRTSAAERDERKKIEKRDKKDRDDEEERLKLLLPFVNYSIPFRHQIHKQRGEEYRIHGRWGWIWMSSTRNCKPQDSRKLGLLAGPHKHVIQVKNDTGKVKTILIDPNVFDKLMAKRSLSQKSYPASSNKTSLDSTKSSEEGKSAAAASDDVEPAIEDVKTEIKLEKIDEKTRELESKPSIASSEKDTPMEVDSFPKSEEQEAEALSNSKELSEISEAEDVKLKLETSAVASPSLSSSSVPSDDVRGAIPGVGRKFRTELVNVSLGIVGANRILYPKIAHKSQFLDNLLPRRIQLQKLEEEELLNVYGAVKLEQVQSIVDNGGIIPEMKEIKTETNSDMEYVEEMLEDSFPLAGSYRYKCYSCLCQAAAIAFNQQNVSKIRKYEYNCYSPMCRLKFYVQETTRIKQEKIKAEEKEKLSQLVQEVQKKKMFTQTDSRQKIMLKPLPEDLEKRKSKIKYPPTSTFRSPTRRLTSIFILPQHEIKKLGRTSGRLFTPSGFAPAPKTGSWAWPYPCGRPLFKTGWQYKTVLAKTLAAAALQLRILWACVKWDDIQMKPPYPDGKNQITTDLEIITSEILSHRISGQFMEHVQYLRKKTVVPIDAPRIIRVSAKIRDSSEITPSRSGLRKRKRAESPDKTDPVIQEEWVDEDKVEIWEIKLYHERQERKGDLKSLTPSTRTKTGITLIRPEKYDPSSAERSAKAAELIQQQETELKMQRAVHLSKRDNHAKTNTIVKNTAPTASQQLQQQQAAAAAAGLPANPRSYGNPTQKKMTIIASKLAIAPGQDGQAVAAASPAVAILNRKIVNSATPTKFIVANQTGNLTPGSHYQCIKSADGKIRAFAIAPDQTLYQTSDGKYLLANNPSVRAVGGSNVQHMVQPSSQSQTIILQSPGPGQLTGVVGVSTSVAQNQPLINISSPVMKTVLASSAGNIARPPMIISQQIQPAGQATTPITYSASKLVRKVSPKLPIADASPGQSTQQLAGLNEQGQLVFSKGGQIITGQIMRQQGQIIVATSQPQTINQNQQLTVVSSSNGSTTAGTVGTVTTSTSPTPTTSSAQTLPSSALNNNRIVIQEGTKTIVVSGAANLTPQQLQHVILQIKKSSSSVQTSKTTTVTIPNSQLQQTQPQTLQILPAPEQGQQVASGTAASGTLPITTSAGQTQIVVQQQQSSSPTGTNVIVKKIIKSPAKPGGASLPITIASVPGAQLQQLIANKNVIRIEKTGNYNVTPSTFQQRILQQISPATTGSSTVTKTPGLPISIVSPSKITKTITQPSTTTVPQPNVVKTVPSNSSSIIVPRSIAPTGAMQQKVVIGTPTAATASPALTADNVKNVTQTTSSPKTPTTSKVAKVAAQFIDTESGPRVVISGFKNGELTNSQITCLQAQVYKQVEEHPVLRNKFGGDLSALKIVLQPDTGVTVPILPQNIVTPTTAPASPVKTVKVDTPVKGSPTLSPVKPTFSSSPKVTAVPSVTAKSPPNAANVDAAIAAVASDVDAPVTIVSSKSPRKVQLYQAAAAPLSPLKLLKEEQELQNLSEMGSIIPEVKSPRKKSPKKTPHELSSILTPVESVPQPIEQDIVITSNPDEVVNEVEISSDAQNVSPKEDTPRFVLSQNVEGPKGRRSPVKSPETPVAPAILQLPARFSKSGSSRRKSPVKTKQATETKVVSPPPKKRTSMMSNMTSPKQIGALNKQKEQLRKDMCKKRVLLEKDLMSDIKEEISEELEKEAGGNKRETLKRKTSDSKAKDDPPPKRRASNKRKSGSSAREKKANCTCNNPHDITQFLVACDKCKEWYHGDCIGINEEKSKTTSDFICSRCQALKPELFCLCKQPYNESQFYVQCDTCDDWLHGHCVGILEGEGRAIPTYVCPNCNPDTPLNHANLKVLNEKDYDEIQKTLAVVKSHRSAWPFLEPVDAKEAPNYYKFIKEPIDLQMVSLRVEERVYQTLRDFIGDITKIFENCRYYNNLDSPFYKNSLSLENFFMQKLRTLRDNMGV